MNLVVNLKGELAQVDITASLTSLGDINFVYYQVYHSEH
jgi:hypothetical protein